MNSTPAVLYAVGYLEARLLTYLSSVGDTGEFNPLEKKKKKKKKTPAAELVSPALVPPPLWTPREYQRCPRFVQDGLVEEATAESAEGEAPLDLGLTKKKKKKKTKVPGCTVAVRTAPALLEGKPHSKQLLWIGPRG